MLRAAPVGSFVLFASFTTDSRDPVQFLDFFSEAEKLRVQPLIEQGLNYVHLLQKTLPRYRQLGDFSLVGRGSNLLDTEPWPYYVKVFEIVSP